MNATSKNEERRRKHSTRTHGFNVENPLKQREGKNHGRQPAKLHYMGSVYTTPGRFHESNSSPKRRPQGVYITGRLGRIRSESGTPEVPVGGRKFRTPGSSGLVPVQTPQSSRVVSSITEVYRMLGGSSAPPEVDRKFRSWETPS